jgi:hypothetical protein
VIRLADRGAGLSAQTIARRLASVSGLHAYLIARWTSTRPGSRQPHAAVHEIRDLGYDSSFPLVRNAAASTGKRPSCHSPTAARR